MNKLFSCDFPFLALYYFALFDNNEILSGDFGAWFEFFFIASLRERKWPCKRKTNFCSDSFQRLEADYLIHSAFFKNRNTVRKKLCEAITWWLNTENVISKKMGDFVFCTAWHFSKFYWIHYCRSSLGIRILSQGRVCDFFLLLPPSIHKNSANYYFTRITAKRRKKHTFSK